MLKPSLQLRLSQQLKMTPQLQQAIRLLQLPIMDLQTQIQEALDENVMLEVDETAEETPEESEEPAELDISESEWSDTQRIRPSETPTSYDSQDQIDFADRSKDTLKDHLLWQLELENLDARATAIGQGIVDGISEDGYLTEEIEAIQATLAPDINVTAEEIEVVLELVQRLDPVGVGARSVSECVLIQLRQLDPDTPGLALAVRTAQDHLELVAENQFTALKRRLGASNEELNYALLLVRACHPRPGSSINAPAAEFVVPDVYVRKTDDTWLVELNTSISPQLKVNQSYAQSLGRNNEYDVLRTQLQEARWLIRSLEIRNETLLKVAKTIVERQVDFLEHGDEYMRPMILKDISELIEMHESTVSRVTTNKYMHTPRGIFELRYFFSSHLASENGEQSSTAVRAKIRKLIGAERPEKPLSDNQIARALSDSGIHVARRTVAKYREGMRIPSSSERKRNKLAS
jgi:RNA polymerase sigma-54 factor